MAADEAADKGYKGIVEAPSGLPCLGCGRTTSSSWRGPGRRYCAKHACRKKGAAVRSTDANQRIEELEERIEEQAQEMVALREGLRAAQQAIKLLEKHAAGAPAQGKAPSAGARRPLAPCNGNVQQAAQHAPPTKKPKAALPAGWHTRPSRSRPGQLTYVSKVLSDEEYCLALSYAPDLSVAGAACYEPQISILSELDDNFVGKDEGWLTKPEMQRLYENCMALPKGGIDASERLRVAFSTAWAELVERRAKAAAEEEREAERHVLEYFEHATCGEAGLALTDETMLAAFAKRHIGVARLESAVARLVETGHMYSTIDDQHYALVTQDE